MSTLVIANLNIIVTVTVEQRSNGEGLNIE